jgi:hypothetical protein
MMTEKYDLQDVLDQLMLAEPQPTYDALLRWIQRYPRFKRDLENFFVAWSESEMRTHLPDTIEIDDEAILERAVKRVLAKKRNYATDRLIDPEF